MKEAPIIPMFQFQNNGLPFKIQAINLQKGEEGCLDTPPHSHNYYEMLWFTSGGGSLRIDLKEYVIGEYLLYCIKPGQVHQVQINNDTNGFILSFTDSFLNLSDHEFDCIYPARLCQLFSERIVIDIQKETVAEMEEIVMKMINEFSNQYSFRAQILKRYFKIFLIYIARHLERGFEMVKQSREIELVKSFMELLDKYFKEKKMVADYASSLSVTPNYLNGIVKKNTGQSASHLIRQRVVLEAKRMGRYSDAGMKEIAYNLGFSDSGHFSKFFKAVSGMNFSDFKRGELDISGFAQLGQAG